MPSPNLVPLLHAPPQVADQFKYVFSEMVRNVLEHSQSPVGAFVAAQYYAETKRIAIGIADAGIGIYEHLRQFHDVSILHRRSYWHLRPELLEHTSNLVAQNLTLALASISQKASQPHQYILFCICSSCSLSPYAGAI